MCNETLPLEAKLEKIKTYSDLLRKVPDEDFSLIKLHNDVNIKLINSKGLVLLDMCKMPTGDNIRLTVGITSKWYVLYLITSVGIYEVLPSIDEVSFRDDVYNPSELRQWCEKLDIWFNDYAEEIIVGRWTEQEMY